MRGGSWTLSSASVPGDMQSFYLALAPASWPVPPFGVLELDIGKGLLFLGNAAVPAGPASIRWRRVAIPVPPDPRLTAAGCSCRH